MNIEVWTSFSKRKNSTLTPPAAGTQVTCVLKEETSIERPSFILNTAIANYTYVAAFGHYYFVDDVININAGMCELVCSMDVLASYKSDIMAYTAFVERSSSSYDVFINDPLLSQEQLYYSDTMHTTSLSSFFSQTGCFLVECLAKDLGVVLYATSNLEPYNYILSPGVYTASDKAAWIQSTIAQAFDLDVYIGSVKWMPFTASDLGSIPINPNTGNPMFPIGPLDIAASVILGGDAWNYSVYQVPQVGPSSHKTTTVSLVLPSAGNFNDFRDCTSHYTQYSLYLPGVGIVSMDPAVIGYAINKSKTISVDIWCDLISGEITYRLRLGANASDIGRYSGNISIDVPIGKSAVDTVKSAKMVAGGIGAGALKGGWIGAIGGAIAGTIGAIYNDMTPETNMIGGSGNKAELANIVGSIHLTRRQFGSRDFPTSVAGRPLMQNVTLSSLTGFVKCGNASVPVNAHASERDAINSFLNSGFYIE